MKTRLPGWLSVVALLCVAAPAPAQPVAAGPVTGRGTAELKRMPDIVRVQVEVLAKAKDLKEALALLKDRREAAVLRLTAMGIAKEALAFNDPGLTSEKTDQQRQMEMMVASRLGRRKGKEDGKGKAAAPPAVVASVLKIDIPFKAADAEDALLKFQALKDKIVAADLSGMKQLKKLTPQEEEIAEETQAPNFGRGGEEEPKRGEPIFTFIATIPEADQAKILADAFAKAKREATLLARAAGMSLGTLRGLESQPAASDEYNQYNQYIYRQQMRNALFNASANSGEAVGLQPGPVTYRIAIVAAFDLK
jgi:uncharacterized protein YggE